MPTFKRLYAFAAAACFAGGCASSSSAGASFASAATPYHPAAREILDHYGLASLESQILGPSPGADMPLDIDRALALALEALLTQRDQPFSAAARALATGSDSPCPRSGPVAAVACFMNRPGALIASAQLMPRSTRPEAELRRRGALVAFALRLPELSREPFWVALSPGPGREVIATIVAGPAARAAPSDKSRRQPRARSRQPPWRSRRQPRARSRQPQWRQAGISLEGRGCHGGRGAAPMRRLHATRNA